LIAGLVCFLLLLLLLACCCCSDAIGCVSEFL
jgi:hypothetical protein